MLFAILFDVIFVRVLAPDLKPACVIFFVRMDVAVFTVFAFVLRWF